MDFRMAVVAFLGEVSAPVEGPPGGGARRGGRASHRMRLERQVARGMDPEGFRHDPDGFDMARQGYVLVTTFPPCEEAWARLQAYLWYGDVWRRGGAKAVDVELRAAEARDEARLAAAGG